jgi:hypothetical protein
VQPEVPAVALRTNESRLATGDRLHHNGRFRQSGIPPKSNCFFSKENKSILFPFIIFLKFIIINTQYNYGKFVVLNRKMDRSILT